MSDLPIGRHTRCPWCGGDVPVHIPLVVAWCPHCGGLVEYREPVSYVASAARGRLSFLFDDGTSTTYPTVCGGA